jgi:hypothetical protein
MLRSPKTPPISAAEVVAGVADWSEWWVTNRRKKLVELRHDSHAVNPFLIPIVMGMHGFANFNDMAAFMLAGHLTEGHATGFGKLIDEKVLPWVFGTVKLDAGFRRNNPPFHLPEYDNIDHIVPRQGAPDLLSLKAGKWSIQLGQAVQLNRSFQVLVRKRESGATDFAELVVGVFYGTEAGLTDKYRIIRGIATKAAHDVVDLTDHVVVMAGRDFWSWLNAYEHDTQEWVLSGILIGYQRVVDKHGPFTTLVEEFVKSFSDTFLHHIRNDGTISWSEILREING